MRTGSQARDSAARRRSATVGIIANPASGKDIRRLVSAATTVDTGQKVNIVRRLLLGITALGIERVEIMPDRFGIGARALDSVEDHPQARVGASLIEMRVEGSAADTLRAAAHLRSVGAGCIVVIGGDGTCRVTAKACGDVPILPLSTGTNNAIPTFTEGTVAGLAAAYTARCPDTVRDQNCHRQKVLDVRLNGGKVDLALVEVACILADSIGARAVWQPEAVRQVFVTQASPTSIGLSSIVGMFSPVGREAPEGAAALFGANGFDVLAPIAPGLVVPVGLSSVSAIEPGRPSPVCDERPAVLALDGEREVVLRAGDEASVELRLEGPWIVDVGRTLQHAVENDVFVQHAATIPRQPA